MISVFNPGPRQIIDHPVANDHFVTLLDNQMVDLENELAEQLVADFPFLEMRAEFGVALDPLLDTENIQSVVVVPEVEEKEMGEVEFDSSKPPKTAEEFEASLKKGERFVCSLCDADFKQNTRYRTHLKAKHNA